MPMIFERNERNGSFVRFDGFQLSLFIKEKHVVLKNDRLKLDIERAADNKTENISEVAD
jgi:hypothetical protein